MDPWSTKEFIGGLAILRAKTKEEAMRFLKLAGDGETEIRQLHEPTDFAPERFVAAEEATR
jgi:hypothetical protein